MKSGWIKNIKTLSKSPFKTIFFFIITYMNYLSGHPTNYTCTNVNGNKRQRALKGIPILSAWSPIVQWPVYIPVILEHSFLDIDKRIQLFSLTYLARSTQQFCRTIDISIWNLYFSESLCKGLFLLNIMELWPVPSGRGPYFGDLVGFLIALDFPVSGNPWLLAAI